MTESAELVELIYEGRGPTGIPNRLTRLTGEMADPGRVIEFLRQRGCGAWRGRKQCAAEVNETVHLSHGSALVFRTYLAAYPTFLAYDDVGNAIVGTMAFVCDRHDGESLERDMPRSLRRSQQKEYEKFLKLGETHATS
jgi:hypothetical protein|tara:strand:- start:81 stop:497 length:417 start_codon:yes stop_codon:yes gene_type:complete